MSGVLRALVVGGLLLVASNVGQAQAARSVGVVKAALTDSVDVGQEDTFLGPDKVKHFMMSGFVESIGFSALQAVNVDRGISLGLATTATLGIGIAKELHDHRTKGLFSLGDLTWDTLGTAAALLVISNSQR